MSRLRSHIPFHPQKLLQAPFPHSLFTNESTAYLGSTTKTPGVEEGKYVEGDDPRKHPSEILLTHWPLLVDNIPCKFQLPQLAHADEIAEDSLPLIVAPFLKLQC